MRYSSFIESRCFAAACSVVIVLVCGCTRGSSRHPGGRDGDAASVSATMGGPAAPPPPVGGSGHELKTVSTSDGRVVAHFMGTLPTVDGESPALPLESGVESLSFTFAGDPRRYLFQPAGKLHFSDWRFDIFSPDGNHVLLLQDRFGPYHVVATRHLRDYLVGKAGPDEEVAYRPSPQGFVPVHEQARWISATEFEFVAGSETSRTIRHTIATEKRSPDE